MKTLFAILILFLLSSCGTMHTDCMTLVDDRDAYRLCSANQGSQTSQYELGVAAFEATDYKTAIGWLKRAARPQTRGMPNYIEPTVTDRRDIRSMLENDPPAPGHTGALWLLERIYREGIGVPVDIKQAKRYREMITPVQ